MASPGGREADRVSVRVVPDTSRFAADLRTALRRLHVQLAVPLDADLGRFNTAVRSRLAELRAQRVTIDVDADRDGLDALRGSLARLGSDSNRAHGPLGSVTRLVASLGGVALTALPNVAGLVGGLAQMAPATAVATTGLLAIASAGAALKIGTAGVADALKGDAEAMAQLAPSARAFVGSVQSLKPAWNALRTDVQQALFDGLASSVQRMGATVLPVLRTQLTGAAGALNLMGRAVADTASDLAESGTLGKALGSANAGLRNLAQLPAQVIRGLVQIGAAAGPSFERITAGAGSAAQRVSDRLSKAFTSGGLQQSIERAVRLVGQLWNTIKNLGTALGNIFGPAASAGSGFLDVLNSVSRTLAQVTGTAQAQTAFSQLFQTLAAAGQLISGTLGAALRATLPLINSLVSALGGPLRQAFATIGPAVQSLLSALGKALAPVVSSVAGVLARLVPIAARLVAVIAGALAPVLTTLVPVVGQLVTVLGAALQPVLAQLPALLAPFLAQITQLAPVLARLASQIVAALAPALGQISSALVKVLVALSPLTAALGKLIGGALTVMAPILSTIIALVGRLASLAASVLAAALTNILIPAMNAVVSLLGVFSGAWRQTRALVGKVGTFFQKLFTDLGQWAASGVARVVSWLATLPGRAASAASSLGSRLKSLVSSAWDRAVSATKSGAASVVNWIRSLPGKAKSALGNLGNVLKEAGKALLRGFLDGIKSMFGAVKGALGNFTDNLTSWKGPPPRDARILRPAGRLVMAGFTEGIASAVPDVRAQLKAVTDEVAAYRPTVAAQVEAARFALGEEPAGGAGPAVSIGTFVANQQQTPAGIARELAWLAKARG